MVFKGARRCPLRSPNEGCTESLLSEAIVTSPTKYLMPSPSGHHRVSRKGGSDEGGKDHRANAGASAQPLLANVIGGWGSSQSQLREGKKKGKIGEEGEKQGGGRVQEEWGEEQTRDDARCIN